MSELRVTSAELKELIVKALEAPYKTNIKEKLTTEELKTALDYYPNLCYNCGDPIEFFAAKIKHINTAQNPPVKFFCSKECRDRWMILVSRTNYDPALNDLIKNVEMIEVWTKLKLNSS